MYLYITFGSFILLDTAPTNCISRSTAGTRKFTVLCLVSVGNEYCLRLFICTPLRQFNNLNLKLHWFYLFLAFTLNIMMTRVLMVAVKNLYACIINWLANFQGCDHKSVAKTFAITPKISDSRLRYMVTSRVARYTHWRTKYAKKSQICDKLNPDIHLERNPKDHSFFINNLYQFLTPYYSKPRNKYV